MLDVDRQNQLMESIRGFADRYEVEQELDPAKAIPYQYSLLKELGIITFMVSRQLGGQEGDVKGYVLLLQELAKISGSLALLALCQMTASVGLQLCPYRSKTERYLRRQVEDERFIVSMAMTEPSAGSDIAAIRSTASRHGERYLLSGEKCFISNGSRADLFLVFAKPPAFRDITDIMVFAVEQGMEGVSIERDETKIGLRGSPISAIQFDNVSLGEEQVLAPGAADHGSGFKAMMAGLNVSRLGAGAIAAGLARAAVDCAIRLIREKGEVDTSMSGPQGVKCALADGEAKIEAMQALISNCAGIIDGAEGSPVKAASVAKYFCTETAMEIVSKIFRIFGRSGAAGRNQLSSILRDLTCLLILEGTSQIHQLLIAREVLKSETKSSVDNRK